MDDHIHNGLMYGFPISDTINYYGCNVIEGQNSEFLELWTYACNGTSSTEIAEKRRLESDFLKEGVYANQIVNAIDLIVFDKQNGTCRTVTADSSIMVKVNNRVTLLENNQEVIYEYDMNGKSTAISSEPTRVLTPKN